MHDIFPEDSTATYTNILRDLEIDVSIGIHPGERVAPQRLFLTIWLYAAYAAPPRDAIGEVVDYDFLRIGIRDLTAGRHFELQETLCDEVARLALADARVAGVRVRSMKPDIYPDASIGCEVTRRRSK